MDPILMQKFKSIKKSKKFKKQQFLDKFFLYTFIIIAFTCSIFCSSPFWFPYLFFSVKDFLFIIFLPKISSILYSPKLLFLVGNLIVVVLIGESKFFASGSSSLSGNLYYDEYVDRSRSFRKSSTLELIKKDKKIKPVEENVKRSSLVEEIIEVKKEKNDLQEEHEIILPTDQELKKRADDFIARVNRQRRLEARLLNN